MDHPAIAQPGESLVDPKADHIALAVGGAGVIVALINPRGHERAVLADDYAIIDHRPIVEQIGKPFILGAIPGQLAFGRVGEGRKGEDREQGRPEDRYDDSDCLDHFFFPGCR